MTSRWEEPTSPLGLGCVSSDTTGKDRSVPTGRGNTDLPGDSRLGLRFMD